MSQLNERQSDISHGQRGGGPLHTVATKDSAGFMSAADKEALDAVATFTALAEPAADRIVFWDYSGGGYAYLQMGSGLSISGTTLNTSAYLPGGTEVALADGGTGASLADPNADSVMFWDDSAGAVTWLSLGTTLTISGTTINVADDGITYAKLQNVSATQRILARNTAGAGDVEEVTATQVLDWVGSTRGEIIFRGSTAWTALATGTSGFSLTTNGTGADPTWAAHGLVLVSTLTTTSGTTQPVTNISSSYRALYIELEGVSFSATATLTLAVSANNGSSYGTAVNVAAATGSGAGTVVGSIWVDNLQTGGTGAVARPSTVANATAFTTIANVTGNAGASGPYNAIRFAGGTFDAGTIRVYGLA